MERAALHYAFETLRVHRLQCEVLAFNRRVIEFHLKHGFAVEGVSRDAYYRDGEYHDIYRLAMLDRDWKHVKAAIDNPPNRDAVLVGRTYHELLTVTAELVDEFAELTGDRNPVHMSVEAAKALGCTGRIAPGMLFGTAFSRIFASHFPGPGTIYASQTMHFLAPIAVGAEVQIALKVLTHIGRRLLVDTKVTSEGRLCIDGTAVLLRPRSP